MKKHAYRRIDSQRGVALVLVLGALALLSVLIMAFMNSANTDLQSSKAFSDSNAVQILSDTAVNVVLSQIRQATTGTGTSWASQPGMIRSYGTDGMLAGAYKLYSSGSMVAASQTDLSNDASVEAAALLSWKTAPALYTDLNEPGGSAADPVYPILAPPGSSGTVDGFSVDASKVAGASETAIPMPVKWLYVLQDGSVVAPVAGSSGSTATISAAASDNPITGRIAFWTDDESCKLNINTAGGDGVGTANDPTDIADKTFWSPPYCCAPDEVLRAKNQPAKGEFQRYPGHPATVALNQFLNRLGWSVSSSQFYCSSASASGITPRYTEGGSKGGAVNISVSGSTEIPVSANRLYSSVSELLFNPDRSASVLNAKDALTQRRINTAKFFLTAHSRAPELTLLGQPRVSLWPVWDTTATSGTLSSMDRLLAFAATSGSAPFYFTRANCKDATKDIKLQRNQELLKYLDQTAAQAVPGFGASFQGKYGQSGARQILTEAFDYIRTINIADGSQPTSNQYAVAWGTTSGCNGWGQFQVTPSLNNVWGSGIYQGYGIYPRLTEAALQFVAMGRGALPATGSLASSAAIVAAANYGISRCTTGDYGTNSTNPALTTNAMLNVGGAGLVPPGNTAAGSHSTVAVQAYLLLHFVNPSQMLINTSDSASNAGTNPFCWVHVKGLNGLKVSGVSASDADLHSLGFPSEETMLIGAWLRSDPLGGMSWGNWPFVTMIGGGNFYRRFDLTNPPYANPLISKIVPVTIDTTTRDGRLYFSGGTITLSLYDAKSSDASNKNNYQNNNQVQTYTLTFPPSPSVGFAMPYLSVTSGTGPKIGINPTGDANDRWYCGTGGHMAGNPTHNIIGAGDVIKSLVLSSQWSDPRLLAISSVPSSAFVAHPLWDTAQFAHSLTYSEGAPFNLNGNVPATGATGQLMKDIGVDLFSDPSDAPPHCYPIITPSVTSGAVTTTGAVGDWDNGIGPNADGPWINKADEGSLYPSTQATGRVPYYSVATYYEGAGSTFFTPNREVPSAGMLGSLPTGVDPSGASPKPWQTLLFRPGPANHPGAGSPSSGPPYATVPDHLFLDLFWMPVVEPYAISEPFSTAGKINLNYQIQPFSYIKRNTALRAVLSSEKVAMVSGTSAALYKLNDKNSTDDSGGGISNNVRFALNLDVTLSQFDTKFQAGDLFRSASQICDIYLVPQGYTSVSAFSDDWYKTGANAPFALVGDNVRERPYTNIYGRVTTKSNTYQIHYRVQSLKKRSNSTVTEWEEGRDAVLAEKRGSVVMERYINPNAALPDFATTTGTTAEGYYRFRTVQATTFHP